MKYLNEKIAMGCWTIVFILSFFEYNFHLTIIIFLALITIIGSQLTIISLKKKMDALSGGEE